MWIFLLVKHWVYALLMMERCGFGTPPLERPEYVYIDFVNHERLV